MSELSFEQMLEESLKTIHTGEVIEGTVIDEMCIRDRSKLEKILFPIVVTIVVCLILPTTAPLVGMLMLGNL